MNHFEVFGIPRSIDVDGAALERRYHELSLQLHPDRLGKATAHERLVALERTTQLNDAFKVLKDPTRRAYYLLSLLGVNLEAEGPRAPPMPPEFLEEILERREALSAAAAKSDLAQVRALASEIEHLREQSVATAQGALRGAEAGPSGQAAVDTAARELAKVKYFARFLEEVEAIEEKALGEAS